MNYLWGLVVAIYLRKSRSDIEDEKKALARGEVYDTLQRHRKELLTFARKNKLKIVVVRINIILKIIMKQLLIEICMIKF